MNKKGFSLVELLVAMAIASVLGMAGVALFSTSNWTYKVNEDVSEAQQNVRVAMEWLSKDIRAAGFGLEETPVGLCFDVGTGDNDGLCGVDDLTFTAPITVTTSGGANSADSITILGIGYEAGTLLSAVDADACNGNGDSILCLDSAASATNFFSGTSAPYTFRLNRRYITLNGTNFYQLAATQTEADRAAGKVALSTTLDKLYAVGTPVYIIQAITYSIGTTGVGCSSLNPCLKSIDYTELRGSDTQTIAESIEDLQFAYGIDVVSPRDGRIDYTGSYTTANFVNDPADDTSIVAVRSNVVAKTGNIDMKGGQFRRPAVEDRAAATSTDGYRRRLLTKIIKLRNPRSGGS